MAKDTGMAQRKKRYLESKRKELAKLEAKYSKARELLEKSGGGLDSQRMKGTRVLLSKIDALKKEIKDMGGSASTPKPTPKPTPRPERAPKLTDSGEVKPAPGSKLKDKGPARSSPPTPKPRPSTPDTRSKKPIAKRLMESLGDKRTMAQATRDREENERMEREMMGRKKGGMAQKNKSTVKKAYGGTVKKKQGGSANKVNMKAGFTRRGCAKG